MCQTSQHAHPIDQPAIYRKAHIVILAACYPRSGSKTLRFFSFPVPLFFYLFFISTHLTVRLLPLSQPGR